MEHPIKQFIDTLFSSKPKEKRDKWAQYLIDQQFDTIDDLRKVSEEAWSSMNPNIPLGISTNIKQKLHKDLQQQKGEKKKQEERVVYQSRLRSSLQRLANQIKNDSEFMRVKVKIQALTQFQDIVKTLQTYMDPTKAKVLAINLCKQLKKDNIIISPTELFEADLYQTGINSIVVNQIKKLIEKGQKIVLQDKLIKQMGSEYGQKKFQEALKLIVKKVSRPSEGSKFLMHKNGVDLYNYKQKLLQSQIKNAKTLIVIGQIGCGKSTFLNALVNYLAGVEMEDTFRYIIIEHKNYQQINDYYIKSSRTGQTYRFIDIPGFGFEGDKKKQDRYIKMISQKLKQDINYVHSVLFVIKAYVTRVASQQKQVFQSVMDLFDKQIAPNFVFIFTFSDSGKPQVLPLVRDKKYGFGNYWDQITEPKYIEVNNCGFFEKIDEKDRIKTHYWKIGIEGLERFFKKINQIQPKSLNLSKQMIKTKETLNIQIINTTQIIQQAINKRENIKKHIQAIVHHKDEINSNKNFTYQVPEDQWYAETTSVNVTRCNNPKCFAEKNCHVNCRYGDGQDKINCSAMENGVCTVCGCDYISHTNSNIIRKVRQVMRKMINSEHKKKYENSSSQMKTSEAALKDLIGQLQAEMKKVINATKKMEQLQEKLRKVQMSDRKPQSTRAYLQYLIHCEYRERAPYYQNRINGYKEVIKQLEVQENILQGCGSKDMEKIAKQLNERIAKNIIDSVEKGFFQRIKKFSFS